MRLALAIPTRGVIFARTIESSILSKELPKHSEIIIVSGHPIPESHNLCIQKAIETDCTHILFVEEDMVIPEGGMTAMLDAASKGHDWIAIDYPLRENIRTVLFEDQGEVLWTGFGCTMIATKIFRELLPYPYLSADHTVVIENMHPFKYHVIEAPERSGKVYGNFDIWFGLEMKKRGISPFILREYMCKHLRMNSWERREANKGTHEIYEI
jgi:hypothetical protein